MTGIASIIEGDEIPLVLFLEGGDTDLYPRAVIRDAAGAVVDTVDLTHQADGIYINAGAAVLMPATPQVSVHFKVYAEATYTTESVRYNPVVDIFARLLDAIKAKTDQMNFTVPSHLDVNMRYHADNLEYGTGTPGDPWRGYP